MGIFDDLENNEEQQEQQEQPKQEAAPQTNEELEQLKQKVAELEQAKQKLEQMLQAPPKPPETPADPNVALFQEVATLKLERYLAQDPIAQKYRDEVIQVLNQIPDPKARTADAAIEAAIKYVKGSHVDEIVKQAAPPPPPPPPSDADAREPEHKQPVVELTDQQKLVASLWFNGDLEAAKRNILGMEG